MTLNANISNTYTFDPSLGEALIGAYSRIGIRRTELTTQHMADARFEANMVMSELQADGFNPWQIELVTQTLIAGQSQYNVPDTTIFLLDVYIRQNPGTSMPSDRILLPISRTDWASTANKTMTGFPTSFWYNRQLSPVLTLWPVPDQTIVNGLNYYVQKRPMDMNTENGTQIAVPYEAYDCFVWMLSERLAFIYAPDKIAVVGPRKQMAYQKFLQTSTENVPLDFAVNMRGYYRM
jgi:hypothetical protein